MTGFYCVVPLPPRAVLDVDELQHQVSRDAKMIALYVDALIEAGKLRDVPDRLLLLCAEFKNLSGHLSELLDASAVVARSDGTTIPPVGAA